MSYWSPLCLMTRTEQCSQAEVAMGKHKTSTCILAVKAFWPCMQKLGRKQRDIHTTMRPPRGSHSLHIQQKIYMHVIRAMSLQYRTTAIFGRWTLLLQLHCNSLDLTTYSLHSIAKALLCWLGSADRATFQSYRRPT